MELLRAAIPLLAPEGILLYATCSLEEEENEQVIEQFLQEHPEFSTENCSDFIPPGTDFITNDGFFASHPKAGMDGFFGARLRKNSTA